MAVINAKDLAERYKLALTRQALVDRYKAAATTFQPGEVVRVKPTHGFEEWHGDTGTIEKYVPFGKYYVNLVKNGRVLIDESHLVPVGASTEAETKEAAYQFLRNSRFAWLSSGMATEARKNGVGLGMKDVPNILRMWFAGRQPNNPKEEAGYNYIQGGAGQLLMDSLIKGVTKALQSTGNRVGLKEVGETIVAFAEDR